MSPTNTTQMNMSPLITTISVNNDSYIPPQVRLSDIDPKGALLFSVAIILVYGMSIVCFIMVSMRKNPVDKDQEKQISRFIKEYGRIRCTTLKEEEQKIRANLLAASMLGFSNNTPRTSLIGSNQRYDVGKRMKRSLKTPHPIPTCLNIYSSEDSLTGSHGKLEPYDQSNYSSFDLSDSDSCEDHPLINQSSIEPQIQADQMNNTETEHISECLGSKIVSREINFSDVPRASGEISEDDIKLIMSRRRKRSGYTPPRKDQLILSENKTRVGISRDPSVANIKELSSSDSDEATCHENSKHNLEENQNLTKTPTSNQLITNIIDISTVLPKAPKGRSAMSRRAQSFRHSEKKQRASRRGSLDPAFHKHTVEFEEPMKDHQFVRSLSCRRRDRANRISTVVLNLDDSGSSNDIILPAVTLPPSDVISEVDQSVNAVLKPSDNSMSDEKCLVLQSRVSVNPTDCQEKDHKKPKLQRRSGIVNI